jgi:hypothetical protein
VDIREASLSLDIDLMESCLKSIDKDELFLLLFGFAQDIENINS